MKKWYSLLFLYTTIVVVIIPVQGISLVKENTFSNKELGVDVIKIWFNSGDESGAITLTKCNNDKTPLKTPEFDIDSNRNNPAAYVKNNYITIKAKFKSNDFTSISIKAVGDFGGLSEKEFYFNNGQSDWIDFTTNEAIPDIIKTHNIEWNWQYYNKNTELWEDFDTTYHTIYSLNKKPITSTVYENLSRWTTKWCEGLIDDDKTLADAIINGFADDKVLQYGGPGWDTAEILRTGDGMCGGMSQVFFDACATQGVKTIGFCFILHDTNILDPQCLWNGIICQDPGLGRSEPGAASIEMTWKWVNETYPYPSFYGSNNQNDDVDEEHKKAYIFYRLDGHMVNLLDYNNEIYLYDLSFGKGPYNNTFESIPEQGDYSSSQIQNFRKNYHDIAVDHMNGRIYYKNSAGKTVLDRTYLSVKTSIIPDEINEKNQILYSLTPIHFSYPIYKSMSIDLGYEYEKFFNDIKENSDSFKISNNEKKLIENWLQDQNMEIDWLELRNVILKLGNLKGCNNISYTKNILNQVLNVKIEINVPEKYSLPGLMSPLNMVKNAAIASLKSLDSYNYYNKIPIFSIVNVNILYNRLGMNHLLPKITNQF